MILSLRGPLATTLLVLAALCAPVALAQTIRARDIAPFEAVYDVGNNLVTAGTARLSLIRDGELWHYGLSTKPTGVFKLAGKGRIRESSFIDMVRSGDTVQLRPRSYSYRQDDEARRSIDATFDWSAGELSWSRRDERGVEPLEGAVLDRLSVTLAAMNALRNGFERLDFEIFDDGRVKTMSFVNEGRERLDTALGRIDTIRVRSENAAGSARSTLTWFAPSLDFVPVRIEQHKRGDLVARLTLVKLHNRVTDIALDGDSLDGDAGRTRPVTALPAER